MSAFRKILTSLLLGAGLSVLFPSCVQTSHVDLDSLRHGSSSKENSEQGAGRRTWTGDEAPEFAFKVNEVYLCDGTDGTARHAFDVELIKGEAGLYSLYWWLDGKTGPQTLSTSEGVSMRQGDSLHLSVGQAARVLLPLLGSGDRNEHTLVLGVSWRGFEKTLATKFYSMPVLSISRLQPNTDLRRTGFVLRANEDLPAGTLSIFVDGSLAGMCDAHGVYTGTGRYGRGSFTTEDELQLFLKQYSPAEHALRVSYALSDGSRTETAEARWTEPAWTDGEDGDRDDEDDGKVSPFGLTIYPAYDCNGGEHVAEIVLTEGDDGTYDTDMCYRWGEDVQRISSVTDYRTGERIDLSRGVRFEKGVSRFFVLSGYEPPVIDGKTAAAQFNLAVTLSKGGLTESAERWFRPQYLSVTDSRSDGKTTFSVTMLRKPAWHIWLLFYKDFDFTRHLQVESEEQYGKYDIVKGYWLYSYGRWPHGGTKTYTVAETLPSGTHTLLMEISDGEMFKKARTKDEDQFIATYIYQWNEP
jgi:hypothetical protein